MAVDLGISFEFKLDICKRSRDKGTSQTDGHQSNFIRVPFFLKRYGALKIIQISDCIPSKTKDKLLALGHSFKHPIFKTLRVKWWFKMKIIYPPIGNRTATVIYSQTLSHCATIESKSNLLLKLFKDIYLYIYL